MTKAERVKWAARVLGALGGRAGKGKAWRVELNRKAGRIRAAQLKAERALALKERMEANLKANGGTVIVRT